MSRMYFLRGGYTFESMFSPKLLVKSRSSHCNRPPGSEARVMSVLLWRTHVDEYLLKSANTFSSTADISASFSAAIKRRMWTKSNFF